MSKKNCKKCGAKSVKNYPTYTATLSQDENEPVAEVQFRRFVSTVINGAIKNFHPSEVVNLKYSIITLLLNTEDLNDSFYFRIKSQRFEYLLEHPEHEDKDI